MGGIKRKPGLVLRGIDHLKPTLGLMQKEYGTSTQEYARRLLEAACDYFVKNGSFTFSAVLDLRMYGKTEGERDENADLASYISGDKISEEVSVAAGEFQVALECARTARLAEIAAAERLRHAIRNARAVSIAPALSHLPPTEYLPKDHEDLLNAVAEEKAILQSDIKKADADGKRKARPR